MSSLFYVSRVPYLVRPNGYSRILMVNVDPEGPLAARTRRLTCDILAITDEHGICMTSEDDAELQRYFLGNGYEIIHRFPVTGASTAAPHPIALYMVKYIGTPPLE